MRELRRSLLFSRASCRGMQECRYLHWVEKTDKWNLWYLFFFFFIFFKLTLSKENQSKQMVNCCLNVFANLGFLVHVSDVQCAKGLVYSECHDKLDDFCYGGFGEFTNNNVLTHFISLHPDYLRSSMYVRHLCPLLCFDCTECDIQGPPWKKTVQVVSVPATSLEQETTPPTVCLTVPVSNMVTDSDF